MGSTRGGLELTEELGDDLRRAPERDGVLVGLLSGRLPHGADRSAGPAQGGRRALPRAALQPGRAKTDPEAEMTATGDVSSYRQHRTRQVTISRPQI